MRITISWVNRNAFAEGHRVYRSTAPIDTGALPTPLATLAAAADTYHDTDVVRGETYYYRIGTYKGSEMVFTANMQAIALPNTGPGPKSLKMGDFNNGYFGVIGPDQLVSGPELKTLTGHGLGAGSATQTWAKVAHKGKILFVAIGPHFGHATWSQLYKSGMMHGTDDEGPAEAVAANGGVGVLQDVKITKGAHTYRVRALKGLPDHDLHGYLGNNLERADMLADSEFNQVMLRLAFGLYHGAAGQPDSEVWPASLGHSSWSHASTLCQDLVAGKGVLRFMRWFQAYNDSRYGTRYVAKDSFGGAMTWPIDTSNTRISNTNTYSIWRPVLELVVDTAPEVVPDPPSENPGAGSDVIAVGDVQLGFYESLPVTSLVSGTELASLVGLTAGDPIVANDDVNWIKYAYEGKTRYVAQKPIRNNLSAAELIAAGLTGEVEKTVVIGDSTYRVTLMEGASPTLKEYTGAGDDMDTTHGSEWNAVMYRLYSGTDTTTSEEPFTNWLELTNADLDTNYYCFTRGTVFGRPSNTTIARGFGTVSHVASLLNESKVPANAWRPVLELVESV